MTKTLEQISEKWSKHIIKRFGFIHALEFALSTYDCPCNLFNWKCENCKYNKNRRILYNCKASNRWIELFMDSNYDSDAIVDSIKLYILTRG